jgi:L-ascorbate metabolism protein UlaG (beta-lactamase superfamily)
MSNAAKLAKKITINEHSSIRLEAGGYVIYFDPFRIPEQVGDADWVFITHEHYDHFSVEDMKKVIKQETVFVAPNTMRQKMLDLGIPDGQMEVMLPDEKVEVLDMPIEAVAAYNKLKPFHAKMSRWLGYIITVEDTRIYVAGDTDRVPDAEAVSCDIALVPCGGTFTMDYKEAAKLINKIKPEIAIPTHYGDIAGDETCGKKFAELVEKDIEVQIKIR